MIAVPRLPVVASAARRRSYGMALTDYRAGDYVSRRYAYWFFPRVVGIASPLATAVAAASVDAEARLCRFAAGAAARFR